MAMREIENMLDELDQINNYHINTHGDEMPYFFQLQDHINEAVNELIESFNTSVEQSRKLLELDRKKMNGEMSLDMYIQKKNDILCEIEKAEYKGEEYLKKLNSYADTLGVEHPQGRHRNAYSFARELVGEYHAFSHAYLKAQTRSIQYDVPFVLNEHAPHSKALMDLANESIQHVKKAMREGALPSDMLGDITPISYLGKEDVIVRSGLGNIANDEPWQNVNALVELIRFDNAQKDMLSVPAIFYPERNAYLISERDYDEKIASIGQPIAKVDVELPEHHVYEPFVGDELSGSSLLKQLGYDANQRKEDRQSILEAVLDEQIMSKQAIQQYFEFRQKMCDANPRLRDVQDAIEEDKKFVDDYEPRFDINAQIEFIDIQPQNEEFGTR